MTNFVDQRLVRTTLSSVTPAQAGACPGFSLAKNASAEGHRIFVPQCSLDGSPPGPHGSAMTDPGAFGAGRGDDVILPPQQPRPQKRAEAGEQDNRNRVPDGDEQRAVVNAVRAIERGTDAGRQQACKGSRRRRLRRRAAAQYLATKSSCIVLFGENPAATPAVASRSSER